MGPEDAPITMSQIHPDGSILFSAPATSPLAPPRIVYPETFRPLLSDFLSQARDLYSMFLFSGRTRVMVSLENSIGCRRYITSPLFWDLNAPQDFSIQGRFALELTLGSPEELTLDRFRAMAHSFFVEMAMTPRDLASYWSE